MFEFALEKTLWSSMGEMQLQVDLQLQPGALVTLYGKSGAGKTSLLRILAGLMAPDQGRIFVHQQLWLDTETGVNLAPKDRPLGFLFQDYALFPNMTVLENLQFALPKPGPWTRVTRWAKAQKQERSRQIADLLEIMELGELRHRKPTTLSGGQQQRVALARALVQRPKLLMLDEPLSALDYDMRLRLQQYILQVHRDFGLTTILVSHDLGEIWRLSDQVWLLEQGKVVRQGTPAEVFGLQVNSNRLCVVGEVVAIAPQAQDWELTCLVGRELLKVVVGKTEINDSSSGLSNHLASDLASDWVSSLSIGARVLITGDLTHPTVQVMGQS